MTFSLIEISTRADNSIKARNVIKYTYLNPRIVRDNRSIFLEEQTPYKRIYTTAAGEEKRKGRFVSQHERYGDKRLWHIRATRKIWLERCGKTARTNKRTNENIEYSGGRQMNRTDLAVNIQNDRGNDKNYSN